MGKLTVAKKLSTIIGAPVFDNAKIVDIVSIVYNFGTEGFRSYRDGLRFDFYKRFIQSHPNDRLISTNVIRSKDNWNYFDEIEALFSQAGWKTRYVILKANADSLRNRVENESRLLKRTLNTWEELDKWIKENPEHTYCPKKDAIVIDSSYLSADEVVSSIIDNLGDEY